MQSLLSIVLAVLLGLKLGIYGILLGNFLGILANYNYSCEVL